MYVLWKITEKFDNSLSHSPAITPSSLSSLSLSLCYSFPFFFSSLTLYHLFFFHLPLLLVLSDSFSLFFLSPSYTHYLCLPPISFLLFLSITLSPTLLPAVIPFLSLFHSFPLSLSPLSPYPRFFSLSLYAMCDFARQGIDCRSIRAPFPPCCAPPLYGCHVYRERRRVLFTGTIVALVLRIHIVEIKFPPPLRPRCADTLRPLWYRFSRILQRTAYLPGVVPWPRRGEQARTRGESSV